MRHIPALAAFFIALIATARATTLPPEMKVYDFAQSYQFADGGVVIKPYHHGFYCQDGRQTPEGLLIKPGATFFEYNPVRMFCEEYHFVHLNETQAFFHERIYRFHVVRDAPGKDHYVRDELVNTDDFYLTRDRFMDFFDDVIPYIEIHPGDQEWRTRP